ncbi:MAG: hypothetical protein GF365_01450 [Candidatus Buchananbacteria bacterium]|nr:hypothetical protein [Candidatus Buchananbacteria bacterium]
MVKNKNILPHTIISEDYYLKVLDDTNKFLNKNQVIAKEIHDYLWGFRILLDLVPETIENFWSGHIFPLIEAEYEIESSIQLCKLGFYKQAVVSLRNILELGLLSVYWDIDGKSHIKIQNWLKSNENTPFKKRVLKVLEQDDHINYFNLRTNFFNTTEHLYRELCNFSHTKGIKYSSKGFGISNVNTFKKESLQKWVELYKETIRIIIIYHILKYPIALQYTPIDDKYGLNGPIGGFLRPSQVERIKKIIPKYLIDILQEISNSDEFATNAAKEINKLPDITEQEIKRQIETNDREQIKMWGFNYWYNQEKWILDHLENKVEYNEKLKYFKKMKLWARSKNLINK